MSWTISCSHKQLCYLNYLFTEHLQLLLYTLKHPKCALVIWLPSSPHTRRNIRCCFSIFEKKVFLYLHLPSLPTSCPTISSFSSFQATKKLKATHCSVICTDSLFSDGLKENIYFTTISTTPRVMINRSHYMKWSCRLVLCDVHRCCTNTIYPKDLLILQLKDSSQADQKILFCIFPLGG